MEVTNIKRTIIGLTFFLLGFFMLLVFFFFIPSFILFFGIIFFVASLLLFIPGLKILIYELKHGKEVYENEKKHHENNK